jgi:hypothetical protein
MSSLSLTAFSKTNFFE